MRKDLDLRLHVPDHLNPDGHRIRVMGTPDNPWFCLPDLCRVLGSANPSQVSERLEEDEKTTLQIVESGKPPRATIYVTEPGLYHVLLTSRSPKAKPFRQWVVKDVLPSIRKHGVYPPPPAAKPRLTLKPYTARALDISKIEVALPDGHWCIFTESCPVLLVAEQILGSADLEQHFDDLLDGSIGQHWAKYREGKVWAMTSTNFAYNWPPPSNRQYATIRPRAYQLAELPHFKRWLLKVYKPNHFLYYLWNKFGREKYQAALPYIRALMPAAITDRP